MSIVLGSLFVTPITSQAAPKPKPATVVKDKRVIPIAKGKYSWSANFGQPGSMWSSGYHTGQDLSAPADTSIVAAANGIIISTGDGGPYGNLTKQQVDARTVLYYAHQNKFLVKTGDKVTAGQPIGLVGSTGNSTGPHLHFEVWIDGKQVDPRSWLAGADSVNVDAIDAIDVVESMNEATTESRNAVIEASNQLIEAQAELVAITKEREQYNDKARSQQKIVDAATQRLNQYVRNSFMLGMDPGLFTNVEAVLSGDPSEYYGLLERVSISGDRQSQQLLIDANVLRQVRAQKNAIDSKYKAAEEAVATADAALIDVQNRFHEELNNLGFNDLTPVGIQTELDSKGCPKKIDSRWVRDGIAPSDVKKICRQAIKNAPTPEAAKAIVYAMSQIGAPYACQGTGRLNPGRFDCSSLVARAYNEGAGLKKINPGETTVTMTRPVPKSWMGRVPDNDIRPGDLSFYAQAGSDGNGSSGHVVMALGNGYMIDTGKCGDGVRIQKLELNPSWTRYEGTYRIIPQLAR